MKKLFSFVLLTGMLTLMSFGKVKKNTYAIKINTCSLYAVDQIISINNQTESELTGSELLDTYNFFVEFCEENNGHVEPVLVIQG